MRESPNENSHRKKHRDRFWKILSKNRGQIKSRKRLFLSLI